MAKKLKNNIIYIFIILLSLLSQGLEQIKIPFDCSYSLSIGCTSKIYYIDLISSNSKRIQFSIESKDTNFICNSINYIYSSSKIIYDSSSLIYIKKPTKEMSSTVVKYKFVVNAGSKYLIFKINSNIDTNLILKYVDKSNSSSFSSSWIIGVIILFIVVGSLVFGGYYKKGGTDIIIYN